MGAGASTKSKVFGYSPVGIVSEVVVVVGKGNGNKGELKSLGEPMRGSRDSSEDFVIVGRGKC